MNRAPGDTTIHVDLGTTRTRVWLVVDGEAIASESAAVGAADTARDGSDARLRATLRELIERVTREGERSAPAPARCVVAAGMIGSAQGLAKVAHVPAPAGLTEIAAGARRCRFSDITELDLVIVPGVRTGAPRVPPRSVAETDVLRGEEVLCLGALERGRLRPGGLLLNLGSHWKLVRLDRAGRISGSETSLAGELARCAQRGTLLTGSVPDDWPAHLDPEWIRAGMVELRRSGLGRALFCVRLLHQRSECSAEERLAFLLGAFLASDLDALLARALIPSGSRVLVTGGGPLAEPTVRALQDASVDAEALSEPLAQECVRTGLRRVLETLDDESDESR